VKTHLKPNSCSATVAPAAIHFDAVRVWKASGAQILREIDWWVRPGERWALIGPNGSGKTTMLSLAAAMRHPSQGRVSVLGGTFGQVDMPALRGRIGLVDSGHDPIGWLTAEEVVLTGIGSTLRPRWWVYSDEDRQRARQLLTLFGCDDLLDREIGTCSQGEVGRVRIARSLISRPELLLLDEPAVGLDLAAREALILAIDRLSDEQPDLTTVLVTHHLEEIPASTSHAMLLRAGSVIASGPIDEVLDDDRLTACFDLPVTCQRDGNRWFARAAADWSRAIAPRNEL
jgi:iron complex transport system ATP-binding protein